jgi:pimeloyl-ACP methyl ester carboxylesterase
MMERITREDGTVLSYDRYGDGPPLVLVHGGFSDHNTNWTYVKPLLEERFTVYAVARRGRGENDATDGHSLQDEAEDVAAIVKQAGEPVFLLGHSYGALCALEAAALVPDRVAKLVLYEPPRPDLLSVDIVARLEQLGAREEWDALVETFLTDGLQVPPDDVAALQHSPDWAPWIADARASLGDMRALIKHTVTPERYSTLAMPVLLLVGSESPRELYLTDMLLEAVPDVRIVTLDGQAHEGMTTAPEMFVEAIAPFLGNEPAGDGASANGAPLPHASHIRGAS